MVPTKKIFLSEANNV